MGLAIDWVAIDSVDPAALSRFWAGVLGYTHIDDDDPDEIFIVSSDGRGPRLLFLRVPEGKSIKNRLHLDLRPEDQAIEVARVVELGARRVDIGQGDDKSWVVLSDPEGNEFCVLRALDEQDRAWRAERGFGD